MKKEEFGLYQTQIGTDVSFASFLTAVVMFFTGLLLSQYDSFDVLIKVPISFLIISTFGFLYASLILANASSEVSKENKEKYKKHVLHGYILSEYIGVYLLILSIPMIINAVTHDAYLRIVALTSSLIGLFIYQFSHFSILERNFKKSYKLIASVIILLGIGLFFAQVYNFYFIPFSLFTLFFVLLIAYLAKRKTNFKEF